jgi:adenylyltransferase/sulfurtransferase
MDERYSRQILFSGVGPDGQERLGRASAVLVGCGALGSVQAELLCRAGLGRLRLIDRDFVEPSNLARQLLFTEEDAAQALPKAVAAARHLERRNSTVALDPVVADLTHANAEDLLGGFDLLLDGTDNFEARFLVNDFSVKTGTPWIYGACVGSYGVSLTIRPGQTPCLRCLMASPPPPGTTPTCDTAGVIGPIVVAVAGRQVAEALKLLCGRAEALRGGMVAIDMWTGTQQRVEIPRDPACATCAGRRFEYLEGSHRSAGTRLCGRNAVQVSAASPGECDLEALAARLRGIGTVLANRFLVRADLGRQRLTVFRDGRAIVEGTEDLAVARTIYARYLGG